MQSQTRILFTIPHFVGNDDPQGPHGSSNDPSSVRASALRSSISSIRTIFGCQQYCDHLDCISQTEANAHTSYNVEIIICTTSNSHLLEKVNLPDALFSHRSFKCQPKLLGFECHDVLREGLGNYDYYCYLEDDLVIHDPWLFTKLQAFSEIAGNKNLLQPNRFEQTVAPTPKKVYVDGNLSERFTDPVNETVNYQDARREPQFMMTVLGRPVVLRRAQNPHSGCFFLNAEQMEYYVKQPHFLDRDTSFVGPLESAATLGIMKTFRIYKPVLRMANFLEIEHFGTHWIQRFEKRNASATQS